jgi:hypothetical protein
MWQVANAAHEDQPPNGWMLRKACQEIWELYMNILDIPDWLGWTLDYGSADGIESHRHALHSEVRQIEKVATQEAQSKGWDLMEIKDLMRGMLGSARGSLREADRELHELKAAHHAACMEDLASEASEVLNRTKWRSRQDCMEFRKKLDRELQAYEKANNELELSKMSTDMRLSVRLQAERVEAKGIVQGKMWRVLRDFDYRWRESQRLRPDHLRLLHTDDSWGQDGR